MQRYTLTDSCTLILQQGDITTVDTDAIVNAANEAMLGGGGVDGAIHRAAGPDLLAACKAVPPVHGRIRCPTGEARITPGFRLPAWYVIHTVGPIYRDSRESAPWLESAYQTSLELANEQGLQRIAFPAISCGVYGYPLDPAADIALATCRERCGKLTEVRFVLFDDAAVAAWARAAERAGLALA